MKKLVVANWKMYQEVPQGASRLAQMIKRRVSGMRAEVVICPPLSFLPLIVRIASRSSLKVGAQDVSRYAEGAHTGEVSARILKNSGVAYVIMGHSERREAGENDETIRAKLACVLEAKLVPILCVGEKVRDSSGGQFAFIEGQLRSALDKGGKKAPPLVIAYEPVWAIGKTAGEAMKPMELQETVIFIRKILVSLYGRKQGLSIPVLYGGSVEAENAGALIKEGGVQGFLVGHASIDPAQFAQIVAAVSA